MSEIELTVNGEQKATQCRMLSDFISELSLGGKRVAVELNKQIVPMSEFSSRELTSGDSLEIVHFVGGG